jgi:hypothetical protein
MKFFEASKPALYDDQFFNEEARSITFARAIVRIVRELLKPRSILDIGCGWGAWLRAFQECGAERICGVDGDYINPARLLVDPACFISCDLGALFDVPALSISLYASRLLNICPRKAADILSKC